MKFGFIGAGQMASALASGIARGSQSRLRDAVPLAAEFSAFDTSESTLALFGAMLHSFGVPFRHCGSNAEVVASSDCVFIATKPQFVKAAVAGIKVAPGTLFVSVVAGTTVATLASALQTDNIIRVMPNTPSLIQQGAIAIAESETVTVEQFALIESLLGQLGVVVRVAEDQLDAVTALSGSGPAYVFTMIEALIAAGVSLGLSSEVARKLAIQTVSGAAQMLDQTGESPSVLRERVSSPGGTTVAALKVLEASGFQSIVASAVNAAARRAAELARA